MVIRLTNHYVSKIMVISNPAVNRTLSQVDHFQPFEQRSFTNMNIYYLKNMFPTGLEPGTLLIKTF